MLGLAPPFFSPFSFVAHVRMACHRHLQLGQAHHNRHAQLERGCTYTRTSYRPPSCSSSPPPHPARGPRHCYHRSRSRRQRSNSPRRRRSTSPHRSRSSDGKRRCHFRSKAPPVCPKCLGRHDDCPVCNRALLWDKSESTRCTRDQHGRLLNKSGQTLCWDFHVDARAKTISMNVPGVVTPTMVHRDAPAANQLFQHR